MENPAKSAPHHAGGSVHESKISASRENSECSQHSLSTSTSNIQCFKTPLKHTLSPGEVSVIDSCYDSDASPNSSRRGSVLLDHSDVSRTVSDTLASELDPQNKDDVFRTLSCGNAYPDLRNQSAASSQARKDTSKSCDNFMMTSGASRNQSKSMYEKNVEFALKLGYTEPQIRAVFTEFGSSLEQNELLSALVELGGREELSGDSQKALAPGAGSPKTSAVQLPPAAPLELSKEVTSSEKKPESFDKTSNLRPIIIDGSNVAMR